jgi:hypothetical protein
VANAVVPDTIYNQFQKLETAAEDNYRFGLFSILWIGYEIRIKSAAQRRRLSHPKKVARRATGGRCLL